MRGGEGPKSPDQGLVLLADGHFYTSPGSRLKEGLGARAFQPLGRPTSVGQGSPESPYSFTTKYWADINGDGQYTESADILITQALHYVAGQNYFTRSYSIKAGSQVPVSETNPIRSFEWSRPAVHDSKTGMAGEYMARLQAKQGLQQGNYQVVQNLLMLRIREGKTVHGVDSAMYSAFFELSPFHSWHIGESIGRLMAQLKQQGTLDKTIAASSSSLVNAIEYHPMRQAGTQHMTSFSVIGKGGFSFNRKASQVSKQVAPAPSPVRNLGKVLRSTASIAPRPFITLRFAAGPNGRLAGSTSFSMPPGTSLARLNLPTPLPQNGYAFAGWSPNLPEKNQPLDRSQSFTARFVKTSSASDPVSPPATQMLRVSFRAGANGSLSGTVGYDVRKGVPFSRLKLPTVIPAEGYKFQDWSPSLPAGSDPIQTNLAFEARFVKKDEQAPAEKVAVTFAAGAHGTLEGQSSFELDQGTAFSAISVPTPVPANGYKFQDWSPSLPAKTDLLNTNAAFEAQFVKIDDTGTDPVTPDPEQVTVTFTADSNGSLQGTTTFTVNKGTAFSAIAVPTPVPADGYKFQDWSPTLPADVDLLNTNAAFEAQFVKADDTGTDPVTPDPEQVTVTFTADTNGSLSGSSVQTVDKGTAFSAISVPTPVAADGYKFDTWSPTLPADADLLNANAAFEAQFVKKPTVVENPTDPTPPADYVRVSFSAGANGSLSGTSSFDILKGSAFSNVSVPSPVAADGYKFKDWSPTLPADTDILNANAAFEAIFVKIDGSGTDPVTPDPEQVTVTFTADTNGSLKGTSTFTVNKGTAFSAIAVPTPVPADGYKFQDWSPTLPADADLLNANAAFKAIFVKVDGSGTDPVTPDPEKVTVTFTAGTNGSLTGISVQTVDKGTAFSAISVPTPVPADGYKFQDWSPTLPAETDLLNANAAFKATFVKIDGGGTDPVTPDPEQVTVTFTAGTNGSLTGASVQTVNKGTAFSAIAVPTPVPADGYKFNGWSPTLPADADLLNANAAFEAQFVKKPTVVENPTDPTPPADYVRVSFSAGANGSLSGTSSFDILKGSAFSNVFVPSPVAVDGYKFQDWSPTLPAETDLLNANAEFKAIFVKLDGSGTDPVTPDPEQVTVTFTAGTNGSLSGTSVQTVNKGTAFSAIAVPTPVAADGYKFDTWSPTLPADADLLNANAAFKAIFVKVDGSGTDPVTPDPEQVTVTFTPDTNGSLKGTSTFTVNKGTAFSAIAVPTPVPADGYKFDTWSPTLPADADLLSANAAFKAIFVKVDGGGADPVTPDPEKVTVTFTAGTNGSLTGAIVQTVNKGTAFSAIAVPTPVPADGYKFDTWSPTLPADADLLNANAAFKAIFVKVDGSGTDPVTPDPEQVTVSFTSDANGSLQGTSTFTVNKGTAFRAIAVPTPVPADGYKFDTWSPTLPADTDLLNANAAFKAIFVKIDGGGTDPVTPDPEKVTVTFSSDANGSLQGTTTFTVNKGTAFSAIAVPTPVPADGYKFQDWSPTLPADTDLLNANAEFKAIFVKVDGSGTDPVTPDPEKVTVTFTAGTNGSLTGASVQTVNKGTAFSAIAVPTPVPADGYKFDTWSPTLPADTDLLNTNAAFKAIFVKVDGSGTDPVTPDPVQVTVTFSSDANGSLQGTSTFTVNKGTAFSAIAVPTPVPADGYKFQDWSPTLPADTDLLNANAAFKAIFVKVDGGGADPVTPDPEQVTVTFTSDANGSLKGTSTFTVNKGTAFSAIAVPTPVPSDGYKFQDWSPTLPADADLLNANAAFKAIFVKVDGSGTDPVTPDPEQVTVTFTADTNGSLQGTSTFTVNKGTAFSAIVVPTPVPADGYKFDTWSPTLPADADLLNANAAFKAIFVKVDGSGTDPVTPDPEQVTVTFTAGTNGSLSGTSVQTVNKGTAFSAISVPTPVPSDGYKFQDWSPTLPADADLLNANAEFKAIFVKVDGSGTDPVTPDPEQVTVTFTSDANGSLKGTSTFTVNKGTAFSAIAVPTPVPADGYKFQDWSPSLPAETDLLNANAAFKAIFVKVDGSGTDPVTPDPEQVTVTFTSDANGSLQGTSTFTVNKGTAFSAIAVPTPVAADGYKFQDWSPTLPADTDLLNANAAFEAQFVKKPTVVENPTDPTPAEDYVRISFTAGANGSLQGTSTFDILKGSAFSNVSVPSPVAASGYKFKDWSPTLPADADLLKTNAAFKAIFVKVDGSGTDPVTPDPEQVTVTFTSDANGSLQGTTTFTVNKGTAFSAIAVPIPVPADGYKFQDWSPTLPAETDLLNANAAFKAIFVKVDGSGTDPVTPDPEQVTVTFTAGANGSLTGISVQTVDKGTAFSAIAVPTPVPADGYKFQDWSPTLPAETDLLNANAAYKAIFVKVDGGGTDPVTPDPEQVTVTFTAGTNGSLTGASVQTVNKGTAFSAIAVPTPVPADGYKFQDWSPTLPADTDLLNANAAFKAIFVKIDGSGTDPVTPDPEQVTVTFTAGTNGSLTGTSVQTVNKGTAFSAIAVPTPVPADGYKFQDWSPTLPADTDLLNANAAFKAIFVKVDGSGTDPVTPDPEKVTVTFTSDANGSLQGTTKFTVNKGIAFSAISVPTPVPADGYKFDTWSPTLPAETDLLNANAAFEAQFVKKPVVVENPTDPTPPADYVRVSFSAGANGSLQGTSTFDILKGSAFSNVSVPSPVAAAGYKFKDWSPTLPAKTDLLNANAAFEAQFVKKPTVVENPTDPTPAEDYVRVSFSAGANGSLQGTLSFDVLKGSAFSNVSVPSPVAADGYKFQDWSPTLPAETDLLNANAAFEAQFVKKPVVVENPTDPTPPADYVRVSFSAGANGSLQGTLSFDVLKGSAFSNVSVPSPVAAAGYKFKDWSPTLPAKTDLLNANAAFEAQFVKKPTVVENPTDPTPAEDYVRISFTAGANGSLHGTSTFDLLKGSAFAELTVPTPVGAAQYEFSVWSPGLPQKTELMQANASFEAQFVKKASLIEDPKTPQPPADYVRVHFTSGSNGSLQGTSTFDILKGSPFSTIPVPETVPATAYDFAAWSPDLPKADDPVFVNSSYEATFVKKPTVVENPTDPSPGEDYVRISFTAGAHGSLQGTSTFDLLKGSAFGELRLPTPVGAAQYEFSIWSPSLPQKTELMQTNASFEAQFVKKPTVVENPTDPTPAEDYVRISFTAGANGRLDGTRRFDLLKGSAFSELTAPTPVGDAQYEFSGWSPGLPQKTELMQTNASFEAQFVKKVSLIEDPKTPNPPADYVRVSFTSGSNGSLQGTTTFDVLKGSPFSTIPVPKAVPAASYEWSAWSPTLPQESDLVNANASYVAQFVKKQAIITDPVTPEPPTDYVRVSFSAGTNGSLAGSRIFDVLKGTEFSKIARPRPVGDALYMFNTWSPPLPAEQSLVDANASYEAQFVKKPAVVANPVAPEPPADYVRVSFVAAEHGKLVGTSVYDVLKGSRFKLQTPPDPVGLPQYALLPGLQVCLRAIRS